ncbi:uncharacterized protein [Dermacentor albipictus]|uniref:uncharacterized protein isoform X2 n=1 Tax=Dermacentor albipictus TaxID=60249 RepID=UPI0038FCFDBA
MFRIPRSHLNRGRTLTTPTSSAASIPAEGDAWSRRQPQAVSGARAPPFRPLLVPGGGRMPPRTRSSPPTPTSRPSTAAQTGTTSFDGEDDDDDERRRGYERPHDHHLTFDEGGGACVVVVAPGPMAAAAAAASKRQNRRRRPPTPVGGDGFPSVRDELRTGVTRLSSPVGVPHAATSCAAAGCRSSSSPSSSSTACDEDDDVGPEHRGRRKGAADDASQDRRSVGSSRTNTGEPRRLRRHSKLGARLMLTALGGTSVVLLALLLAYNTQLEQDLIHRVKSVFDKGQGKRQARADANSTHYTGVAGSAVDEAAPSPHRRGSSTTPEPTLPESAEEFEQRLRQMVSRFWTPRDQPDYSGSGGFGFDPPRARAARRGWPRAGRGDDDADVPPRPPMAVGGDHEPTEPMSQPLVRDALRRRADWFLVQARRSHGRLPDASWPGDGESGNASRGAVEIEKVWQEGDDWDDGDGAPGLR